MNTSHNDQAILQTLSSIPYGKVCTYGTVAKLSGNHGKARYIGYILKNLPKDSSIPWYRVVNSQGYISFPEGSPQHDIQRAQLEAEEVTVLKGKVNLKHYLWAG